MQRKRNPLGELASPTEPRGCATDKPRPGQMIWRLGPRLGLRVNTRLVAAVGLALLLWAAIGVLIVL